MAHGASPRHARRPKKKAAARSPRASGAKDAPAQGTSAPEPPPSAAGPVRLQKLLASAGFGSRRQVEAFLTEGRVTVNGRAADLGERADLAVDDVRVDGERLVPERPAYWIVNKPRGVVTTVRDEAGRRTVIDLLPRSAGRLYPVGRLDRETSGLLLLTNDGDATHTLLHPSHGNEREYRVQVRGALDDKALRRLAHGVTLEEGRTAPARVSGVRFDSDTETTSFGLTLVEGKKRQIRRSLLVLGFPVRRLVRVRMGPLRLGRLAVGEARPLRAAERRALLEHVRRLRAGEAPEAAATTSDETRDGPRAARPTRSRGRGVPRTGPRGPREDAPPAGPRGAGSGRPPTGPASAKGSRSTKGRPGPPSGPAGAGTARGNPAPARGRPPTGPASKPSRRASKGPAAPKGPRPPRGPAADETGAQTRRGRPSKPGAKPARGRPSKAGAKPARGRPAKPGAKPARGRPGKPGAKPTRGRPAKAGADGKRDGKPRSGAAKKGAKRRGQRQTPSRKGTRR